MNNFFMRAASAQLAFTLLFTIPVYGTDTDNIYNPPPIEENTLGDYNDFEDNIDIPSFTNDQGELNWYYVGKGKDNIAEGPKESVDFLQENDAYFWLAIILFLL